MANKTFNTRLKLKYDTYTNWNTKILFFLQEN